MMGSLPLWVTGKRLVWLPATLFTLVLLPLCSVVCAEVYLLDDGIIEGSFQQNGAAYANRFQLSDTANQVLRSILIKKPDSEFYDGGTADVHLWDDDGAGGLPGTILASAMGVVIPRGDDWVEVNFMGDNIVLQPGTAVYAGFICQGNKALFDASGGGSSYRKVDQGDWLLNAAWQSGLGDLMVRLTTSVLIPTVPETVKVLPFNPTLGDTLTAMGEGSVSPEEGEPGSELEYEYEWRSRPDSAAIWSAWGRPGPTIAPSELVLKGEWQARGRAAMGGYASPWKVSGIVTIRSLAIATTPPEGASQVNRMSELKLEFQWPMVQASVDEHFALTNPEGTPVEGTKVWQVARRKLTFRPDQPLARDTAYVCTVGAGAERVIGGAIAEDYSFSFTTDGNLAVTSALPVGTGVTLDKPIEINFDKSIRPFTVTAKTFRVTPEVSGTLTVTKNRIDFVANAPWQPNTRYEVVVGPTVRGTDGKALEVTYQWTFETGAEIVGPSSALSVSAVAAPDQGQATPITVTLSAAAEVTVEISNIAGRLVATLPARSLPQGLSTLLWNGKSRLGTSVPSGDYLLRVQARAADGSSAKSLTRFSR